MAEKKTKLAEIKTKPTSASVEDFISNVKDEQKRPHERDRFNSIVVFSISMK